MSRALALASLGLLLLPACGKIDASDLTDQAAQALNSGRLEEAFDKFAEAIEELARVIHEPRDRTPRFGSCRHFAGAGPAEVSPGPRSGSEGSSGSLRRGSP